MPPAPDPGLSVFQDINEVHPGQTIRCHIDFLHSISSTPVLALVVEVQNDEGLLTVAPIIVEGKPPHPNLNDPAWQRMRSLTLGLLAFSSGANSTDQDYIWLGLPVRVPFQACSESMMFRSNETDEEMDENRLVYRIRRMAFQSGLDTTRDAGYRVEQYQLLRPQQMRTHQCPEPTPSRRTPAKAKITGEAREAATSKKWFQDSAFLNSYLSEGTSQQPPAAGSRIDSHSPEPMAIDVSGQTFILRWPGLSAADVCMFDLSDAPRNSNDEKRELYGLPRRGISISDLIHPQNSQKKPPSEADPVHLQRQRPNSVGPHRQRRIDQHRPYTRATPPEYPPMRPTYQPAPQKSPDFSVARGPPAAFL
ncbi:hypothetical protein FB45DRAFT_874214 [Roridomyces roridus]|uniref:Uncharacterized protein n=1 Tax=Roridomyces roridus TaxID=1738132 RepID=A0AAD7FEI2_9AGAR|nr:hypothetical protein FB45DRAFT_874214 [Roridomyces roridus]